MGPPHWAGLSPIWSARSLGRKVCDAVLLVLCDRGRGIASRMAHEGMGGDRLALSLRPLGHPQNVYVRRRHFSAHRVVLYDVHAGRQGVLTRCAARTRQSAPFVGRDAVASRAADPSVLRLSLGGIRKGDVPGLVGWERDLAIDGTARLPAIRPHMARPLSGDSRRVGLVHHHYRNAVLPGHVDPAAAVFWLTGIVSLHIGIRLFLGLRLFGLIMILLSVSAFGYDAWQDVRAQGAVSATLRRLGMRYDPMPKT